MDSSLIPTDWSGGGTSFTVNSSTSAWISNAAAGNLGTVVFTLQSGMNINSFQLVERPLVPNGQPDKVIVEGGP